MKKEAEKIIAESKEEANVIMTGANALQASAKPISARCYPDWTPDAQTKATVQMDVSEERAVKAQKEAEQALEALRQAGEDLKVQNEELRHWLAWFLT